MQPDPNGRFVTMEAIQKAQEELNQIQETGRVAPRATVNTEEEELEESDLSSLEDDCIVVRTD